MKLMTGGMQKGKGKGRNERKERGSIIRRRRGKSWVGGSRPKIQSREKRGENRLCDRKVPMSVDFHLEEAESKKLE
jgi:hypothetical protein